MTVPEDKSEARRLDLLLARAYDNNNDGMRAEFAPEAEPLLDLLYVDGFISFPEEGVYELTARGRAVHRSGRAYFYAWTKERDLYARQRRSDVRSWVALVVSALAALGAWGGLRLLRLF